MARQARILVPGLPHHVTQRGNRRWDIFRDHADRTVYLRLLREQCVRLAIRIWAYTLMTNHVHLIAVPNNARALSVGLKIAHGDYTSYFNKKYGEVGHGWQERFKASALDEAYLWNAVRYVERNPVRAGMIDRAEDYPWSSAAAHCGLHEDPLLSNDLPMVGQIPDWSAWLRNELPVEALKLIRDRTCTGRPCGDDDFVRKVGAQLGRDLALKKPERKKAEAPVSNADTPLFEEIGD